MENGEPKDVTRKYIFYINDLGGNIYGGETVERTHDYNQGNLFN